MRLPNFDICSLQTVTALAGRLAEVKEKARIAVENEALAERIVQMAEELRGEILSEENIAIEGRIKMLERLVG
jgi:hypothetical protein